MDLETKIYKYSLMIGGALLTVLFLLCTIFCIFMGPGIGWGGVDVCEYADQHRGVLYWLGYRPEPPSRARTCRPRNL